MKVTGVPYEEIARAGGGIRASARALAEASDDEVLAQARGARAPRCCDHGTTTFEAKTGYGLSREGELRALRLARELAARRRSDASTALLAHAVPDGYDARTSGWTRSTALAAAARRRRARHLRRVGRVRATSTSRGWARSRARTGWTCARTSSSSTRNRSVPVALAAGARSVDHLACLHPDDLAPLARRRVRGGAAARARSSWAPSTPRRRARWPTPARSACWPPTATPARRRSPSLPLIVGLAVRRYGWSAREALRRVTLNAAWVLGGSEERRLARGRQARRPRGARRAGRARRRTASATTRWPSCRGGELAGCGPTRRGGCG